MKSADRQTRSYLMDLFARQGLHPRTDLGQNFLIDLNLVEFIVAQAELGPQDVVLEIGSGTGSLTAMMGEAAGQVISVEVDRRMHALAQDAVARFDNVTLLQCDALHNKNRFTPEVLTAVQQALDEGDAGRRLKLVSNLPYNIATPVVSNLLARGLPWSRMVITIQWELAQRMAAKPGTNSYGALSVWLQAQAHVRILKKLRPEVFWPRPKVTSAIVRLLPAPGREERIVDRLFLQDFLRRLFHQRRKLLRSVLVGMYRKQMLKTEIDRVLGESGLPEGARAEDLEVSVLVDLSNRVHAALEHAQGVPE